jgi:membrane protease YdiL (CAAX protease family)
MNPAQMPHAFLIGLLLGWMYYRTDSIVPGVVYHWVNNTAAYIMYNLYPNPDLTLLDLFGSQRAVMMALGFSFCIFLPALFQLNLRLKK